MKNTEEPIVEYEILRVDLKSCSTLRLRDRIVFERHVELYLNGELYVVFSASPFQIRELAVGHLLAEGLIEGLDDIEKVEASAGRVNVYLSRDIRLDGRVQRILSACGGGVKVPPGSWMKPGRFIGSLKVKFSPQIVLDAVKRLNSEAHVFKDTGGTHASALFSVDGQLLAFSEDIGRHNAVDKVIGRAAINGVDFNGVLLASTGRLTSEMVVKAATVGIPVVASMAAPSDMGVKIAESAGLTLIGFVRGGRFNVYTHPERIVIGFKP